MILFKVKEYLFFRSGVYMQYMSIGRAGMTQRLGERALLHRVVFSGVVLWDVSKPDSHQHEAAG